MSVNEKMDVNKIKEKIAKYQEQLHALEEFDRTGALPKKRVNFTVDQVIFEKFRKYCEEEHISMSGKIESYMKDFTKKAKVQE